MLYDQSREHLAKPDSKPRSPGPLPRSLYVTNTCHREAHQVIQPRYRTPHGQIDTALALRIFSTVHLATPITRPPPGAQALSVGLDELVASESLWPAALPAEG